MSGIRIEPYFHQTSNFTACQNSLGEHSFEGVPASLYSLTKSVPDPFKENDGFHVYFVTQASFDFRKCSIIYLWLQFQKECLWLTALYFNMMTSGLSL